MIEPVRRDAIYGVSIQESLKRRHKWRLYDVCLILFFCCTLLCSQAWSDDDNSSAPAMDTYNKAVRLYEAKRWDTAKDYFHQYLAEYSDTPLYVTCLYYLAYCYQQLGDQNQAVLLYHKVIDQAQGGDAFWGDMAQKRIEEVLGT